MHDMEIFKKLFYFATFSMVLCLSLVFLSKDEIIAEQRIMDLWNSVFICDALPSHGVKPT
jgi:hypothetical protein